jgi:hypothetical protein
LGGVTAVLNGITRDELEAVFEEWVARLDACLKGGGDDVEEQAPAQETSIETFADPFL